MGIARAAPRYDRFIQAPAILRHPGRVPDIPRRGEKSLTFNSETQPTDRGSDHRAIWHRGLRAARQASETRRRTGPAQGNFQGRPEIERRGENADKSVAGTGRVERLDWQGRHFQSPP